MNLDKDTGIFCFAEDSSFFDYFFQKLNLNLSVYSDVDKLRLHPGGRRIACIQIPYPYDLKTEQLISKISFDLVIILCTEMHAYVYNFIRKYDKKNFVFFTNGDIDVELMHAKRYTYMDWFRETSDFYRATDYLKGLKSSDKNFLFECLLGRKKSHRDQVYNHVQHNGKILTKYSNSEHSIDFTNTNEWISDIKTDNNVKYTVDQIKHMNRTVRLSQLIPTEVYNQSYYSIVAETNTNDNFTFLTEKTAKPLIAGRLFTIAGNKNSLKTLHRLGFKTFDSVIDESYDSVDGQYKRIKAMLEQVDYLCTQDPGLIYEKIKLIVKHNQELILNREWQQEFLQVFLGELKTG